MYMYIQCIHSVQVEIQLHFVPYIVFQLCYHI